MVFFFHVLNDTTNMKQKSYGFWFVLFIYDFFEVVHILQISTPVVFLKSNLFSILSKYMIKFFRFLFTSFSVAWPLFVVAVYSLLFLLFSFFIYNTKHKNHNKNYEFITLHGKITF